MQTTTATQPDFTLTPENTSDLKRLKSWSPFLAWFGVKTASGEFCCFNSRRKANKFAKENAPAAIFAAQ
jgi:hypothetical protein